MLEETLIVVVGTLEGVIVAQPCAQASIAPYASITLVQLINTRSDHPRRPPKIGEGES